MANDLVERSGIVRTIGIIFAMQEELDELLKYLDLQKEYEIFDLKFYEGVIHGNNCILVECGVGKVNAARCTQILIDNMKVDYIFNIGVAGGIDESLHVGDIIIGKRLVQHDFDITAFNHEKGYIPNVGVFVESDEYLVRLAEFCKEASDVFDNGVNVLTGTIASGDIFCTETRMSEKIHSKFEALCVEMEGASIAQVCYLSHVPFLIIRSISDVPNNDNVITYEEFLKMSSKNVARFMAGLLEKKL